MNTLSILPWLTIPKDITIGKYQLIQYKKGLLPGGELQNIIDRKIDSYWIHKTLEIKECTILKKRFCNILKYYSEDDIEEAIRFAELLSFSSLANRSFFTNGKYCNKTDFTINIINFGEDSEYVSFLSNRRDGSTTTGIPNAYLKIIKPFYTNTDAINCLNKDFVVTLNRLEGNPIFYELYESILLYNLGNSDSNEIRPQMEVILLCSAFERLLGIETGRKKDLIEKANDILIKKFSKLTRNSQKVKKRTDYWKDKSLFEIWFNDFYDLRNDFAHGKLKTEKISSWSVKEHLILASYIFPLLFICVLVKEKKYTLNNTDILRLDSIEEILDLNIFKELSAIENHPWIDALSKIALETGNIKGLYQ